MTEAGREAGRAFLSGAPTGPRGWTAWLPARAPLGLSPRRDAQRIEELFAKNQQLREQQRLLKENLQVLENR